jgi:hypothetical protein
MKETGWLQVLAVLSSSKERFYAAGRQTVLRALLILVATKIINALPRMEHNPSSV